MTNSSLSAFVCTQSHPHLKHLVSVEGAANNDADGTVSMAAKRANRDSVTSAGASSCCSMGLSGRWSA